MATSSARTVFVLGRESEGNRSVVIVESGKEYSIEYSTAKDYSNGLAKFPYAV
jgi:hypothetical protein